MYYCSIFGFLVIVFLVIVFVSLHNIESRAVSRAVSRPTYLGSSADGQKFFADKQIRRNWTEAGEYCREFHLLLATVQSQQQNAFLKLVLTVNNSDEQYWTQARENRHTLASLAWDDSNDVVAEGIFDGFTDATGGSVVTPYQNCGMYEVKSQKYALMAIKPCYHYLFTLCMNKS